MKDRRWHKALADVGQEIENESKEADVYVVQVCVDQGLDKNPRGHAILARLGEGEDADIYHFSMPFWLHFETTVHAVTNAVEIITTHSQRRAILYVLHFYALKHAFLPSDTEYGHDAHQNALRMATWPHQLMCAWLPATTDWPVIAFLKTRLKRMREQQEFAKSMAYFKALI